VRSYVDDRCFSDVRLLITVDVPQGEFSIRRFADDLFGGLEGDGYDPRS
jgi:hypothetical protein